MRYHRIKINQKVYSRRSLSAFHIEPVNSNTTGTITPMFSSYDWMKPNLKQKAGTWREPRWENGLFERTGESYEE